MKGCGEEFAGARPQREEQGVLHSGPSLLWRSLYEPPSTRKVYSRSRDVVELRMKVAAMLHTFSSIRHTIRVRGAAVCLDLASVNRTLSG